MVLEMTAHLKDGNQYRFIEPGWSPGKTMYFHNHPEYVEPDWNAHEILMQDMSFQDEIVWRTLQSQEYEHLYQKHWREILDVFRTWAREDDLIP